MRPRIMISKRTLMKIFEKVKWALRSGDMKCYKKAKALYLVFSGVRYAVICEELQVNKDTIRRWVNDFYVRVMGCFKFGKSSGRPSKLTKSQRKELTELIKAGPNACGFKGSCWRTPMIQHLIFENFGVLYSVNYLSNLLKNLGFSYQKAKFVSGHLNEDARKEWLKTTWLEIMKLAEDKNSHILFGDEASFPQWGSLSYTWSPVGEQPIVKTSGKRKGYKVFGFIDYFTGKFFHKAQEERLNSDSYKNFLKEILKRTTKHIIIIQNGARYHTSKVMKEFFKKHEDRMTVFQMPSYSPDYNPIEKLWKKIKQHGTHLKFFPTFEDLTKKVEEMLVHFEKTKNEVLSLFGFYDELYMGNC